ncbi:hypothetical protein FG386_000208 [Cryptosporidium ryanae]|uniref:uncharacterized protein n=1 Tax=Cryptosporidium ryanae TaxID=515981 RepID=UPI00351A6179|nr:hypothetical protein FG386_000208 [Cryptosporidium ryanae]
MSIQEGLCELSKNIKNENIVVDNKISDILFEIDTKCIKPTICFLKSIPSGFVPIRVLPITHVLGKSGENFSGSKDDNKNGDISKGCIECDSMKAKCVADPNNVSNKHNFQSGKITEGMSTIRQGSFSLGSALTHSYLSNGELTGNNILETENNFFPEFKGNCILPLFSYGSKNLACRDSSFVSDKVSVNKGDENRNNGIESNEKLEDFANTVGVAPSVGNKKSYFDELNNEKNDVCYCNTVISAEQIRNICKLGGINNENIWTALFCRFYEDKDGNNRKKYSMPYFLSNKIIMESYSNIIRSSEPQSNSIQIHIYCRDIIKNYCSEVIAPRILLQANLFTIWNNSIKDLIMNKGGNKIFYELFRGENLLGHNSNRGNERPGESESGNTNLYQLYSNLIEGNLPSLLFLKILEEEFAKFSVLVHLFTRIFGHLDRNNCHVFSSPNLTETSLLYFYKYVFFPFSVSFSAAILNIITIERDHFMQKSLRALFTYKIYDENVFSSLQRRGEPCLGFISDLRGVCSKCMVETHFSVNFDSLEDTRMEKLAGRSYRSVIYNVVNNIIYVMSSNTNDNISLKRTNTFDFDSDTTFVYPEKREKRKKKGFSGSKNNSGNESTGGGGNTGSNVDFGTRETPHSSLADGRFNFGASNSSCSGEKGSRDYTNSGVKMEKRFTNWNKISKTIDSNKIGVEESTYVESGLFWFISKETDLNIYRTTIEDPILKSIVFYYTSRLDGIFDILDLKQCCILINWILIHEERRIIRIFPKTSYSKFLKVLEDILFQFFSKKILNFNSKILSDFIYIDENNNSNLKNDIVDCSNFVKESLSTYINNENYCALKLLYILVFKDSAKQKSFKILNELLKSAQKDVSIYKKLEFPLKEINFDLLKDNLTLANIFGLGCLMNADSSSKNNVLDYFSDRLPSMVYFVYVIYESIIEEILKAMKLEVFNLNSGIKKGNMRLSSRFKSIQIVLSILDKYRKFAKYSFLNDSMISKFIFKAMYDGLIIYIQRNISKNSFNCLFTLSFWLNSFIDNRILQIYSFVSLFQDRGNIDLLDEKLELYRKQQLHLFIPSFLGSNNSFAPGTSEFGKYTGTFQSFNSKEYFLKFKAFSFDWIGKLFNKYTSFICDYFNSVKSDSFDLLNSLENYIEITELELFMNNIVSGIIMLKMLLNCEIIISHYKDRLCKRLLAINCLGNNRLLYPARNLTTMLICISMEYFFLSFMDTGQDSESFIFGSEFNDVFSSNEYNEEEEMIFDFKSETNFKCNNNSNSDLNSTNECKNKSLKSLDYLLDDCVLSLFSNSLSTGCFNAFITCDFNWRNNRKFVNIDLGFNIKKIFNESKYSKLTNKNGNNINSFETPYLTSDQYFEVEFSDYKNSNNTFSSCTRLNYSNINLPEKIKLELENIENSYSKIYPHRKLTWILDTGFVVLNCIGFNVYSDVLLKNKSNQFDKVEILTSITTALVLIYIGESNNGNIKLFDLISETKLPALDVIRVLLSFIIPGQNFVRIEGISASQINMEKIKDWKNWLYPDKVISLGDIILSEKHLLRKSNSLVFCPKLIPIEFFIKYNINSDKSNILNRWIMFNIEYFKKSVPFIDEDKVSNKDGDFSGFVIRNDYFLKYSDLVEGINFPTLNSKVYKIKYPWNINIYLDDDKYECFSNFFSEVIGSDDIFCSLYNVPVRVKNNNGNEALVDETVISGIYVYKDNHNIVLEENNDKKKDEILYNDTGGVIFGNINDTSFLYSSCSSSTLYDLDNQFKNSLGGNTEISNSNIKVVLNNNGLRRIIDSESKKSGINGCNSNKNDNLYGYQSACDTKSSTEFTEKTICPLIEQEYNNRKRISTSSSFETDFINTEKLLMPQNLSHYSSSSSCSSSSFLSSSSLVFDAESHSNKKRQKLSGCFTGIIELVCKLESIIVKLLKRNKTNKYTEIINYIQSNWNPSISDIPNGECIDKALIKLIKREFITLNCNHKNNEMCSCKSNLQKIIQLADNTKLSENFFEKDSIFNYVP